MKAADLVKKANDEIGIHLNTCVKAYFDNNEKLNISLKDKINSWNTVFVWWCLEYATLEINKKKVKVEQGKLLFKFNKVFDGNNLTGEIPSCSEIIKSLNLQANKSSDVISETLRAGDIVFYGNESNITHIAIVISVDNEKKTATVMEGDYKEYYNTNILQKNGGRIAKLTLNLQDISYVFSPQYQYTDIDSDTIRNAVVENAKNTNEGPFYNKYNQAYYGSEIGRGYETYEWCACFVWWFFSELGAASLYCLNNSYPPLSNSQLISFHQKLNSWKAWTDPKNKNKLSGANMSDITPGDFLIFTHKKNVYGTDHIGLLYSKLYSITLEDGKIRGKKLDDDAIVIEGLYHPDYGKAGCLKAIKKAKDLANQHLANNQLRYDKDDIGFIKECLSEYSSVSISATSINEFKKDAADKGLWLNNIDLNSDVKRGDIIVYSEKNNTHIAIIFSLVYTIEGNTSLNSKDEEDPKLIPAYNGLVNSFSNGGRAWGKDHTDGLYTNVSGRIRPAYSLEEFIPSLPGNTLSWDKLFIRWCVLSMSIYTFVEQKEKASKDKKYKVGDIVEICTDSSSYEGILTQYDKNSKEWTVLSGVFDANSGEYTVKEVQHTTDHIGLYYRVTTDTKKAKKLIEIGESLKDKKLLGEIIYIWGCFYKANATVLCCDNSFDFQTISTFKNALSNTPQKKSSVAWWQSIYNNTQLYRPGDIVFFNDSGTERAGIFINNVPGDSSTIIVQAGITNSSSSNEIQVKANSISEVLHPVLKEKVLALAIKDAESFVCEDPPDSNCVKYNTAYFKRETRNYYPWDVVFVWWLFDNSKSSSLFCDGNKVASCGTVRTHAKKNNQWYENTGSNPISFTPGDIAIIKHDARNEYLAIIVENNPDKSVIVVAGDVPGSKGQGIVERIEIDKKSIVGVYRPLAPGTQNSETSDSSVQPSNSPTEDTEPDKNTQLSNNNSDMQNSSSTNSINDTVTIPESLIKKLSSSNKYGYTNTEPHAFLAGLIIQLLDEKET